MKAITIKQPWASLIAAGVKTIETRPRRTSYRGRIAIHAAAHLPSGKPGPADLAAHELAIPGDCLGRRICACGWDAAECLREGLCAMPRGAVVASAVLTDCVPMVQFLSRGPGHEPDPPWTPYDGSGRPPMPLLRIVSDGSPRAVHQPGGVVTDVSDQEPFGDFRPGRWALLLDDIKPTTERCPWCWGEGLEPGATPDGVSVGLVSCRACNDYSVCDPIPARGQQAVPWEWTP